MEQLTIIGLLIIIILILLDRNFSINTRGKDSSNPKKNLPSIIGETKKEERKPVPSDADHGQKESIVTKANNFDSETKGDVFDDILVKNNDWYDEEEDWQYQDDSKIESGFATGVTFQELSTAGQLLQQDVLKPDLERQAVDIIQGIQGTELFDLLENSLGDASKRIASLLSSSISNDDEIVSSKQSNSSDSFDIRKFV
ncbi:hypothetical protein ACP3T3_01140 [Chryseobacterium sp. CBSDS_008]|uniref:hypothetical protein n=1 Tax=Chryseobacterium sp. CBSDS_008 TaxID=3415265 RepID=UPI003CEF16CA